MTRKEALIKSLASDIPQRIIDQKAESVAELAHSTGRGRSWMAEFAKAQVAAGHWESVWKRVNKSIVPAYRRAK